MKYKESLDYINKFINQGQLKKGSFGLDRVKYLLSLCGNPEENMKVIHIAGTSGKGSVAYITSALLVDYRFKVGLHISPHLIDIRERLQINNRLIPVKLFCKYLTEFKVFIELCGKSFF